MSQEVLLFEIADVLYGLNTQVVREVLRAATPSAVPDAPPAVGGVINLRGRVVPVLHGRRLFGLTPRDMQVTDHLIVIEQGDCWAALHVDRALDLLSLDVEKNQDTKEHRLVEGFAKTTQGLAQVVSASGILFVCGSGHFETSDSAGETG